MANIVTGLARLENTKLLDDIAQKYRYIVIKCPKIPMLSDMAIILDPFNITISVRVFKKMGLSLKGYGHGVDVGVGSCHYTVTE